MKVMTLGADPGGSTPAEFGRFILDEPAKWRRIVVESGAKLDWLESRPCSNWQIVTLRRPGRDRGHVGLLASASALRIRPARAGRIMRRLRATSSPLPPRAWPSR